MAVKKNSLLDPETAAIEAEFENQKEGPYIPAPPVDATLNSGAVNAASGVPSGSDPRSRISDAYRSSLGREGSESEISSHLGRGSNIDQSLSNITGSQEAKNYAASKPKMAKASTPTTTSTASTTVPGVGQEVATVNPAVNPGAKNYDVVEGADQLTWGDTSRLSGFNTNEWGEGGTEGYHDNSVKNTFGKLATRYDPSPDGARQLVNDPDFKRMFPQAVLVDHPTDPKIQFFPDDPPVDVLIASGEGGWGWQPEGGGGGGAAGGAAGGMSATPQIDALGEGDILAKIQAALAAMGKGEQPFMDDAISQEFA